MRTAKPQLGEIRWRICLLFVLAVFGSHAIADTPWRVDHALGLPDWLHISGTHRTRYETLDNQFRANGVGGDQMIALRTIVLTELRFDGLRLGVEMIDSRAMLDDQIGRASCRERV